MGSGAWVVIVLFALNTIIAIIMFIAALLRLDETRATRAAYAVLFLVCPIVGFTIFLCVRVLYLYFSEQRLDTSNLSFSKSRVKTLLPPDESTEMNYVPIKDALVTQDRSSLRRLLLDLLKNNAVISAHSVSVAVGSADAETSHYAASAITDFLSEFRSGAQQRLFLMNQSPRDVLHNLEALEYLNEALSLRVMDDIEQRSYVYTMGNVAENLFINNRWYMSAEHYLWMVDHFLEIDDAGTAAKWMDRAIQSRPEELNTYKCVLHYHFKTRNPDKFFQTLETLKASNIWIDKEILDLVRVMSGPGRA